MSDDKYLSQDVAEKCLEVVKTYLLRTDGPGWEPALYPPGHEGEFWAISLEGAEDWSIRIGDADVTWPDGVFTEPVYSWCLGLYPAA